MIPGEFDSGFALKIQMADLGYYMRSGGVGSPHSSFRLVLLVSGLALGIFEVFGQTSPSILGRCQLWHPLFTQQAWRAKML